MSHDGIDRNIDFRRNFLIGKSYDYSFQNFFFSGSKFRTLGLVIFLIKGILEYQVDVGDGGIH